MVGARVWLVVVLAVSVAACGSSSAPARASASPVSSASAATAASVAVQPTDVPASLQQCSQSGSIDHYLNTIKATDPGSYSENLAIWTGAHARGATAAQFIVYADSKAHCLELATAGGPQHGDIPVTYAFLEGMVIQFNDEATAASEYGAAVFTISPNAFQGVPGGAVGTETGFGLNSETYFCIDNCGSGPGIQYEVLWQKKAFDAVLSFANLDLMTSKTIALDVNNRMV